MRQQDKDYIAKLHPKIRDRVTDALAEAERLLTGRAQPIITFGLRTVEEQQALYEQGRTKPGQKVTNAKGGQSYHNYGLAIDFALLIDGKTVVWETGKDYDGDHVSDWMEVVKVFKAAGFTWGGDWVSLKDYPHFEMTFGYHWPDLLALYNTGKFIPGTKYVLF